MDRKAVARETLQIMDQGYYEYEGQKVSIQSDMDASVDKSRLITPDEGAFWKDTAAAPAQKRLKCVWKTSPPSMRSENLRRKAGKISVS